jgi:hypothetical protein
MGLLPVPDFAPTLSSLPVGILRASESFTKVEIPAVFYEASIICFALLLPYLNLNY